MEYNMMVLVWFLNRFIIDHMLLYLLSIYYHRIVEIPSYTTLKVQRKQFQVILKLLLAIL